MKESLRRVAAAGVLATAAMGGMSSVDASGVCVNNTHGIAKEPGQTITFKAKRALVTGDVYIDGIRRYDDLAETGAVDVLTSNHCVTWKVEGDFGASAMVIADKDSQDSFLKREVKAVNNMATTGGHDSAVTYVLFLKNGSSAINAGK